MINRFCEFSSRRDAMKALHMIPIAWRPKYNDIAGSDLHVVFEDNNICNHHHRRRRRRHHPRDRTWR